MSKSYYDLLNEISADELYDGLLGYGFFAEKLPPVFTTVQFLDYCKPNKTFKKKKELRSNDYDYIAFSSVRNINVPRIMGIPTPFQYANLCAELRDDWKALLKHFEDNTAGQSYPVSRIHIRKIYDKETKELKPWLFEMNYKNWKKDGSPEDDLLIVDSKASRYIVHADISTCFPSIYTHSIPWAAVGKEQAKKDAGDAKKWYNRIDTACQRLKNWETHGLIIGVHASNLIAEIILVVVDKNLYDRGFRFVRNIDDYDCYVDDYQKAQEFLNALEYELRQFDLPLNHKKTMIEELPKANTEHWIHKLKSAKLISDKGNTTYIEVNSFIDTLIKLSDENGDSAVIKYGIKQLSGLKDISDSGQIAGRKRIMHLSVLYPYLLPLMEEYVFNRFGVDTNEMQDYVNALYRDSLRISNYEGVCYSIFFALKYDCEINSIECQELINIGDCLVLLFAWLYYRKRPGSEIQMLEAEALRLRDVNVGRYWLFVYEVLNELDLPVGDWQNMKKAGISFIVEEI